MTKSDLLHQRGMCCFNAYLRNRAVTVVSNHKQSQAITSNHKPLWNASDENVRSQAAAQYSLFIILLQYTPNVKVFPNFASGAIDVQQQIIFVILAWAMDYTQVR